MKKILMLIIMMWVIFSLTSCNEANRASRNLSTAADDFQIERRIVFYNWITDTYMLTIEWKCSLWNNDTLWQITVTCKVWDWEYKKHFLWLSDNVTYFVEQVKVWKVSWYSYKVMFRPQEIIPDFDLDIK